MAYSFITYSKSWKKRKSCVDSLCLVPQVLSVGLSGLIHTVIETVYREHFTQPAAPFNTSSMHYHSVNVHYNNFYNAIANAAATTNDNKVVATNGEISNPIKISNGPTITQMAVSDSVRSDDSSSGSNSRAPSPVPPIPRVLPSSGAITNAPVSNHQYTSSTNSHGHSNYSLHYESEHTAFDPLHTHCKRILEIARDTASSQSIEVKELFNFFKQHRKDTLLQQKESSMQKTQHQVASLMAMLATTATSQIEIPYETPYETPYEVPYFSEAASASPSEPAQTIYSSRESTLSSPRESARSIHTNPGPKVLMQNSTESAYSPAPLNVATALSSRSKQAEVVAPTPAAVTMREEFMVPTSRSKQAVVAAPIPAAVPTKKESTTRTSGSKRVISDATDRQDIVRTVVKRAKVEEKKGTLPGEQASEWLTTGSKYIGRYVKRKFGKQNPVIGVIVGWLPADGKDIALWHVEHVDGDEEDLDELEVKEYILPVNDPEAVTAAARRAAKGKAVVAAPIPAAVPTKEESTTRISRSKPGEFAAPVPVDDPETIIIAARRAAKLAQAEVAAPIPVTVPTKKESTTPTSRPKPAVVAAPTPAAAEQASEWLTTGSKYIGRYVKRKFGKQNPVIGVIVGWLPADGEDIALWHVEHVDGDEEDLDELEVKEYILPVNDPEAVTAAARRAAKGKAVVAAPIPAAVPTKKESTTPTSRSKQAVVAAPTPAAVTTKKESTTPTSRSKQPSQASAEESHAKRPRTK